MLITVPGDFQARFFNGVLGASRRAASQGYSTAGAGAIGRRQSDRVVVSHGVDPNFHGGTSEKKELAPNRRGSVVLGEIADYIDRYGYDVQPLTCGFSPAKPSRCTR